MSTSVFFKPNATFFVLVSVAFQALGQIAPEKVLSATEQAEAFIEEFPCRLLAGPVYAPHEAISDKWENIINTKLDNLTINDLKTYSIMFLLSQIATKDSEPYAIRFSHRIVDKSNIKSIDAKHELCPNTTNRTEWRAYRIIAYNCIETLARIGTDKCMERIYQLANRDTWDEAFSSLKNVESQDRNQVIDNLLRQCIIKLYASKSARSKELLGRIKRQGNQELLEIISKLESGKYRLD